MRPVAQHNRLPVHYAVCRTGKVSSPQLEVKRLAFLIKGKPRISMSESDADFRVLAIAETRRAAGYRRPVGDIFSAPSYLRA